MNETSAAFSTKSSIAVLADRTILEVTGPDRATFLHSFTTNDIKRLSPGRGCEAFVTSPQGKTLGHVLVFCEPDRLVLDTAAAQAAALIAHFERYVITEEVTFADRTAERHVFLIAGPDAASILENATAAPPPTELLSHALAMVGGLNVNIRKVPYTTADSYFVESAAGDTAALRTALFAAGAHDGDPAELEAARLEAGFPLFGRDITPENLPQEVARDAQAIGFTKGCYLGQETVARIDALGHVNRLLRGVEFSGSAVPPAGALLLASGQPSGHVTSAGWSKRLNAPLALAYLRRQHAKSGTSLTWDGGDAEVVDLPLPADA